MKLSVRNIAIATAMMAAAVVMVESAKAETTVKVPFNFTVAGKVMPAGSYKIDKDISGRVVTMQGNKTPDTFRWVLTPGEAGPTDGKVTLSFDEKGTAHALKAVKYGSMTTSQIDSKVKKSNTNTQQGQ